VHAFGEIAGAGVVHHGVGTVALAGVAVTVGAVFVVDGLCGGEIGVVGGERIFAGFGFGRNFPGGFVESSKADGKKDQDDYQAKENFDGGF